MLREINDELITDDKLLTHADYAEVLCRDCAGCSSCCIDTACMIVLDAFDIALLKKGLNYSFEGLLGAGIIKLDVIDGIVLPGLNTNANGACVLLNEKGRCSIHAYRPGICRMFPLARIYHDDGSFSYFLQKGECDRTTGEKVRISEWLGYDNIEEYEASVKEYHRALSQLRLACANAKTDVELKGLQMAFLQKYFM